MTRRTVFLVLLLALLAATGPVPPVPAPDETRFRIVPLTGGLPDLLDFDIAPNGDAYLIGHGGGVYRWNHQTGQTERLAQVPVAPAGEIGLLALALDPQFARTRQVFLHYAPAQRPGVSWVARFTLQARPEGDTLVGPKVVLELPDTRACCHGGGAMAFDRHGNLYITTGDQTNPFGTNYSPADERPGRALYDAQRTAANSRDLRGKILRIRPTTDVAESDGTYTIPAGNLFPKDGALGRPEIYIMGCRNPFRLTFEPGTEALLWSEIGPDASDDDPRGPRGYDELNRATRAGNYGWPYFIGKNEAYAQVDFARDSVGARPDPQRPRNTSPHNTGLRELPPARPALLAYPYDALPEYPALGAGGRTLVAGPFYAFSPENPSSTKFPAYFHGKLLLADWMRNWLRLVTFGSDGWIRSIEPFLPGHRFRKPIALKFGPDGALYLLEYGALWGGNPDSRLVRIEYLAGNRPPRARLVASADAGAAPLRVVFSGRPSNDPDPADRLRYQWFLNDRPAPAQGPDWTHRFDRPGTYRVRLLVRDAAGASSVADTTVRVGNEPPRVTLSLADPAGLYGPRVRYRATAQDPEDGPIPADSVWVSLRWIPANRAPERRPDGQLLPPHHRGRTWIEESDCRGCHAPQAKSVGPSWEAIATRYAARRNDATLVAQLSQKIRKGGGGVWGEQAMSAHPQLSPEVTDEMVRYLLAPGGPDEGQKLPATGEFATRPGGTYVLTARYTDRGTAHAPPLTREVTRILRAPQFSAQDFDPRYELRYRDEVLTDINKAGYAALRGVDLTGVREVVLRAATTTTGTRVEVRLGGPTGTLLAEAAVPPGKARDWREITLPLPAIPGEHDVYFVFQNRQYVLNLLEVRAAEFRK